jgi:ribosomal protein L7/L12
MKLTLTTNQAIKYLTDHFRGSTGVSTLFVEINDDVVTHEHLAKYYEIANKFGKERFGDKKIQAIKELRDLIPGMSLQSSKYIIEQVNDVRIRKYIEDNNTLLDFS